MFEIQLHNLRFFSLHGAYREEKVLGNEFIIDVTITIDGKEKILHLEQTVNYVTVYEIIKERMTTPTPLLETLAQELAELIYNHDNRIRTISISIRKAHPPVPNFEGSLGISFKKEY